MVESRVVQFEALLKALLHDFAAAPLDCGKKMRDLLKLDPEAFQRSTLEAVAAGLGDTRGCRYLVVLLSSRNLLIPLLSDPSMPLDRALELARVAAALDDQMHVKLTQHLIDTLVEKQSLPEDVATRLLEILSTIADSASLHSLLSRMVLHRGPRPGLVFYWVRAA